MYDTLYDVSQSFVAEQTIADVWVGFHGQVWEQDFF